MAMNRLFQILGVLLLLAGIAGFILPGNNTLGFPTNLLHDAIHIVTGLAFLWAGTQGGSTLRNVALTFGIIYALVTVLGFIAPGLVGGLMADNPNATLGDMMPDNLLHLVLTAIGLYAGLATTRAAGTTRL